MILCFHINAKPFFSRTERWKESERLLMASPFWIESAHQMPICTAAFHQYPFRLCLWCGFYAESILFSNREQAQPFGVYTIFIYSSHEWFNGSNGNSAKLTSLSLTLTFQDCFARDTNDVDNIQIFSDETESVHAEMSRFCSHTENDFIICFRCVSDFSGIACLSCSLSLLRVFYCGSEVFFSAKFILHNQIIQRNNVQFYENVPCLAPFK